MSTPMPTTTRELFMTSVTVSVRDGLKARFQTTGWSNGRAPAELGPGSFHTIEAKEYLRC